MFTVARFARSVRVAAPHAHHARSFSAASPSFITLDESSQTLSALTSAHPRVLAYFTATWCGPCRAIAPKFAALAGAHAGVKFVKIDVDDNADTMAEVRLSVALLLRCVCTALRCVCVCTALLLRCDALYPPITSRLWHPPAGENQLRADLYLLRRRQADGAVCGRECGQARGGGGGSREMSRGGAPPRQKNDDRLGEREVAHRSICEPLGSRDEDHETYFGIAVHY
jgi:thiol-disulfide isomerase/thioredoxin